MYKRAACDHMNVAGSDPETPPMLIWSSIGLLVPSLPAPTLVQLYAVVGVIVAGALVQRVRKLHRARVDPMA